MILHFYSLRINKNSEAYIKHENCEAVKVSGLYRPQTGLFPIGNGRFEIPKQIGKLQISKLGGEMPYVVLTEPNMEHAKEVLIEEYIDKKIEFYEKKVSEFQEKRKAIENLCGEEVHR